MLVIPNQSEGVLARYSLSREQVDRAVWAVDRAGARWEGSAAIRRILIELGGPWRIVGRVMAAPGLAAMSSVLYRMVAAHRGRLTALLAGRRERRRPPGHEE